MSCKTEQRWDNGNKCDWRRVWASCKAPAVTLKIIQTSNSWLLLAEPLHVCVCLCVWYYVRLNAAVLRPPPSLLPHSVCLCYLLLFSALLLFIPLPLKPQSSLPPIFFSFFISYYSPATRLIRPLNWASGRQSLSPRRHQAKQHPAATVTGSRQRLER